MSKQFDSAVETGTLYREQIVVGNILMQRHRLDSTDRKESIILGWNITLNMHNYSGTLQIEVL